MSDPRKIESTHIKLRVELIIHERKISKESRETPVQDLILTAYTQF
jgi:hypothetical protein